VLLNFKKNVRF